MKKQPEPTSVRKELEDARGLLPLHHQDHFMDILWDDAKRGNMGAFSGTVGFMLKYPNLDGTTVTSLCDLSLFLRMSERQCQATALLIHLLLKKEGMGEEVACLIDTQWISVNCPQGNYLAGDVTSESVLGFAKACCACPRNFVEVRDKTHG